MSKRTMRVLSLILTLVMFLSLSTPAFAWGPGDLGSGWGRDIGDDDVRDFDVEPDEEFEEEYDYFQALDEENNVQVTIEAPMGALPSLAEVRLEAIPAADLQDAVDDLVGGNHAVLLAMDISFWLGSDEIEPEEPVRVKISAPELEGRSDLQVVHFPDDDAEEPETLRLIPAEDLSFALGTNEICFESASFSVYAVIDGQDETTKLTVNFYDSIEDDAEPISTQVLVKTQFDEEHEAPLIDPGVPALTGTQSFEGWSFDNPYTAASTRYDIEELNEYIHEHYSTMTANATLDIYAMVFDVFYVTYHDQAGAVLKTESVICPVGGSASVLVTNPYVPFKQGQNFAGWTPDILVKGDYPSYPQNPTVYQDGSTHSFSADLRLYPYVKTGSWLSYDNYIDQDADATSASYTSPEFYENGANTVEPATPERVGYTFEGWYTDKNFTTRYVFGGNLTTDTTVYAHWTPNQTTYYVVFWQQSANDAVDAANSAKTYDFYKSVERSALTGTSVSINTATSGTTADNRLGGNSTSSIGEMGYYFTYNETNTDTGSVVVKGDGSTVLNVYYDRRVITINFHQYITSGYDYTSGSYGYYNVYQQHFGYYNGSYYYLTMSYNSSNVSSDGYIRSNYVTWYRGNTQYTGTIYILSKSTSSSTITQTLTGLYDSVLDNWPDPGDGLEWKSNSGNYNWDYGMTLPVYSYKIWGTDGRTYNDTTWDIWVESSGGYNFKDVHYLGQDTDGNYTINLADYEISYGHTLTIDHTLFYGYSMYSYQYGTSSNANAGTETSLVSATEYKCGNGGTGDTFGSYTQLTFKYARNKWNFVYESNNHDSKTESVFFQKSLSDLASYVPTDGPRGCYFDGWYADPGFDTPFNFDQEMPNHSVRIYAKWTLMRFRVVLDPTGGDPNVTSADVTFPGGTQATTFRLNYGEQVQGSSINNAQRQGYTLLGWYLDPEYTQPFNFGQPITDAVAVMGYNTLPAAQRQGIDPWNNNRAYDDADGEHEDVRGKVMIYARWRADPEGTIGVHVTYDAMDGSFSSNNAQTWEDPYIYADQAEAYAQPASTPTDTDLHFLYWEIMKPTSSTDPTLVSTGKKVYPGQTWDVLVEDAVKEELSPSGLVLDPANLRVIRSGAAAGIMAAETTTVASWDFESSSLPSGWTISDADGDGYNWMAMYGSDYTDYAHGGQGYIRSNSYQSSAALSPDNWIFTNAVTIPADGTTTLSFWIRAQDPNWPGDIVKVYVCTAQTATGAVEVSGDIDAPAAYTEETIDLTAYAGQTVYIAFRHYNCTDLFAVNIDDVSITNEAASEFTVRFYDHNNTLLSEQTVEKGGNATPPADPEAYEENGDTYVFVGWDASYSNIQADTDIHAVYILSSQQTVETTRYTVYLHAVYGRMDAGKVTHINFYSNTKDEYGNPIAKDDIETKGIEELKEELGLSSRDGEVKEVLFYEGGESSKTYDERDGYNLYYDNIKVIEDEMPIPVPYSIEGYRFLGWGRVSDIDSIPEGHQASEYVTDPDGLNADNLFLKYVEDNSEAGFHWEAQNKSGQWVTVTKVAANEEKPYHDLYAVWEPVGKVLWYSNVQDVTLAAMELDSFVHAGTTNSAEGKGWYVTNADLALSGTGTDVPIPANTTYSYNGIVHRFLGWSADPEAEEPEIVWNTDHYETNARAGATVTTVNIKASDYTTELGYTKEYYAVWQSEFYVYHTGVDATNRAASAMETIPLTRAAASTYDLTATPAGLTAGTLYGGYYLADGFTVTGGETNAWPAYDGTNFTFTTPQTVSAKAMQPVAGQTYYIKEVPASKYLQPYFHYTYLKESDPAYQALRSAWLISDIDDAMYKETGFVIQTDDKTAYVCTQLTVQNTVGGASVVLKPQTIFRGKGVTSGYLSYLEVMKDGACTNGMGTTATILQYWVTPDNLIVTGVLQRTYGQLDTKTNVKNSVNEVTVASTIEVFNGGNTQG